MFFYLFLFFILELIITTIFYLFFQKRCLYFYIFATIFAKCAVYDTITDALVWIAETAREKKERAYRLMHA